jgi:acetyltransferase-like isoleucine patch superfamily enzyme
MGLTARLNALPFDDLDGRRRLLTEIFGPVPDSLSVLPPLYCDHGLGTTFGERVFVNQGCFFLDLGGITIGDRATITPGVTIGHGSVVGAGAVVATDVPPLSVVTGTSTVVRKRLQPPQDPPS